MLQEAAVDVKHAVLDLFKSLHLSSILLSLLSLSQTCTGSDEVEWEMKCSFTQTTDHWLRLQSFCLMQTNARQEQEASQS